MARRGIVLALIFITAFVAVASAQFSPSSAPSASPTMDPTATPTISPAATPNEEPVSPPYPAPEVNSPNADAPDNSDVGSPTEATESPVEAPGPSDNASDHNGATNLKVSVVVGIAAIAGFFFY